MHQTQSWSILHRILAYKSTPNAIMKYLIPNFYLKEFTTYSEKEHAKLKTLHHITTLLHQIFFFFHQNR